MKGCGNQMMTTTDKFHEYISALVSVELSMMMAIKWKEPVNLKVKASCLLVAMRCKDLKNRQLFLGVSKAEFPAAMVYHIRTMLDEQISL